MNDGGHVAVAIADDVDQAVWLHQDLSDVVPVELGDKAAAPGRTAETWGARTMRSPSRAAVAGAVLAT
jgi:hypothetical protein